MIRHPGCTNGRTAGIEILHRQICRYTVDRANPPREPAILPNVRADCAFGSNPPYALRA